MGQDEQPKEAGRRGTSLKCATGAVKRWAAALGRALGQWGDGAPPGGAGGKRCPHRHAASWAPVWRLATGASALAPAPPPRLPGPGLTLWLDVGPPVRPQACRAAAAALGLDGAATLLCPGLCLHELPLALALGRTLPQVALVVLDARGLEGEAARALGDAAYLARVGRHQGAIAALTVFADELPVGAAQGAHIRSKWPKLDHLRGIA